ncbi:MAG: putative nucleotidyltransferase [Candidatus Moranbacteria bacterium GW2011_GWE2_35_2-]|nr:MAG: putative nucleotidyltransferase [Candidatus Moranbacteria bacterium GW2011_GWE2_35_2-]KKQ22110.1 MAG: putative nucleotidyltransferase [Candidatus Moranbacteria bacterium GW2011_GWF2_37_11]KKQ29138.1 MAG: putative nucleotidyltransferase [Candidatus Moranbacteria bacterium GW2011_GWD1_37_17]KKQ31123.1 MAG: putative nucleotidyltransferase [Candidatus Moranbacteria bacterium GW2011_GWE1_37_24]HBO16479.1 nucleotidyltransferase domain-containing protein [Candidatus Moranbacteria bacterium]
MKLIKDKTGEFSKIFAKHKVVFAYLFGSQATGKAIKNSDIDIAIMLSKDIDAKKRFDIRCKIISELSKIFKKETEVVILNDTKSILFKFVIIKEGKLIYAKDHGEKLEFELKTMNDYYDFAPFIEKYNEAYLKRELNRN